MATGGVRAPTRDGPARPAAGGGPASKATTPGLGGLLACLALILGGCVTNNIVLELIVRCVCAGEAAAGPGGGRPAGAVRVAPGVFRPWRCYIGGPPAGRLAQPAVAEGAATRGQAGAAPWCPLAPSPLRARLCWWHAPPLCHCAAATALLSAGLFWATGCTHSSTRVFSLAVPPGPLARGCPTEHCVHCVVFLRCCHALTGKPRPP